MCHGLQLESPRLSRAGVAIELAEHVKAGRRVELVGIRV